MFNRLKEALWIKKNEVMWKKRNRHNQTYVLNRFDIDLVSVGRGTYGGIFVLAFNNDAKLDIGNYCSIAGNVRFILSADHKLDYISTYPFKTKILGKTNSDAITKGDIIIDDDVWIGDSALILSGVHIGQGAVVAAGAIVTSDVPPYAIVGGVPAKVIKYRFGDNIIQQLKNIDYSILDSDKIRKNTSIFYSEINSETNITGLLDKIMNL